jgi:hypothetical protein
MKLTDPDLLWRYMDDRDFTQARLARHADCSRQFIWQLLNDPRKRTCTPQVATRIEEALGLLKNTLFVDPVSPETRHTVLTKAKPQGRAA